MIDLFSLQGKTAWITGGSRGIGRAIARGLAQHGAGLVLLGRDITGLESLARELTQTGTSVEIVQCDLSNASAVEQAFAKARETRPRIDVLVNAAGVLPNPLEIGWEQAFQNAWQVNVLAPMRLCHLAASVMKTQGSGKIINVTSVGEALVPSPNLESYGTSKAALRQFSRCLAVSLGPHNIQVNVLAPGFISSGMSSSLPESYLENIVMHTPLRRAGHETEVVGGAVLLASQASNFMTGSILTIDGGLSVRMLTREGDYSDQTSDERTKPQRAPGEYSSVVVRDKVVLVTGATRGIGRATAEAFAKNGAQLAVLARNRSGLHEVAADLGRHGIDALALPCNIADRDSVERAMQAVKKRFGRLDVLVNCAGVLAASPSGVSPELWNQGLAVNLLGAVNCVDAALPMMSDAASIINIGSIGGITAPSGNYEPYGCSKAALHQYSRTLAVTLAPRGIRVNTVSPGIIDTEINGWMRAKYRAILEAHHPAGQFGTKNDVVGSIMYLASEAAGFVTGTNLVVDGGMTLGFLPNIKSLQATMAARGQEAAAEGGAN